MVSLQSTADFTGQYRASFNAEEFQASIKYLALIVTELISYLMTQTEIAPDAHTLIKKSIVLVDRLNEIAIRVIVAWDVATDAIEKALDACEWAYGVWCEVGQVVRGMA